MPTYHNCQLFITSYNYEPVRLIVQFEHSVVTYQPSSPEIIVHGD